jgi:hypothetical protein
MTRHAWSGNMLNRFDVRQRLTAVRTTSWFDAARACQPTDEEQHPLGNVGACSPRSGATVRHRSVRLSRVFLFVSNKERMIRILSIARNSYPTVLGRNSYAIVTFHRSLSRLFTLLQGPSA